MNTFKSFGTDAIHAGQEPDPHTGAEEIALWSHSPLDRFHDMHVSVCVYIYIYIGHYPHFVELYFCPKVLYPGAYEYARTSNPTRKAFEECVAKLEGAKYGLAFSSGLGATTTLIHTLDAGDHVIVVDDVYGATQRYFRTIAAKVRLIYIYI